MVQYNHGNVVSSFFYGRRSCLSGFEHVVVGEQESPKTQGYHFWYKYFLDDGFARQVDSPAIEFPGLADDRIVYLGSKQSAGQTILF
jgi:poly(U)-specific endoribonuclease